MFEIAKVYLPEGDALPREERMLGIVSNHRDYPALRGVVERLVDALGSQSGYLAAEAADEPLLDPGAACRLRLGGQVLGYVGQVRPEAIKDFEVGDSACAPASRCGCAPRARLTVAEVKLGPLVEAAELTPRWRRSHPIRR